MRRSSNSLPQAGQKEAQKDKLCQDIANKMTSIASGATWLQRVCSAQTGGYARRGVGVASPVEETGSVSAACRQAPEHLDQPPAIGDHCIWRIAPQRRCCVFQSPAHPAPVGALVRGQQSSTLPHALTWRMAAAAMDTTCMHQIMYCWLKSLFAICWPSLLQHDNSAWAASPAHLLGVICWPSCLSPQSTRAMAPQALGLLMLVPFMSWRLC